jgi:PKD repeat protein
MLKATGNLDPVLRRIKTGRILLSMMIPAILLFNPPPAASEKVDFTFSSIEVRDCAPHHVTFTDASSPAPIEYEWSFPGGDPSSSTDQGPISVTYRVPGTYSVTLTAHFFGGTVLTVTKTNIIHISDCRNASIGDLCWQDIDWDGIQDEDEPGMPHASFEVQNTVTREFFSSSITGIDGHYRIEGLPGGHYTGYPLSSMIVSPGHEGMDDSRDSDLPLDFNLPAGAIDSNTDFGTCCYVSSWAPDPYPWRALSNCARHAVIWRHDYLYPGSNEYINPLHLGLLIDYPSFSDFGSEHLNDPDGIEFITPLIRGTNAEITANSTSPGLLNSWIDWNIDGDWADEGEHILTEVPVTAGDNRLSFLVPGSATAGMTWIMFRLSTQPGLSFIGHAINGEVENYRVGIWDNIPAQISGVVWQDLNGNGIREDGEPGFYGDNRRSAITAYGPGSGGAVKSAALKDDGSYILGDLAPNNYQLNLGIRFCLSPSNQGDDESRDSDFILHPFGTVAYTEFLTLSWGDSRTHVDAGIYFADFGDAPAPYPSMLSGDGARHSVIMRGYAAALTEIKYEEASPLHLGSLIRCERDGCEWRHPEIPTDNDGVEFLSPLVPGTSIEARVTSTGNGLLSAWIDLNRDGDWSDAGEQVLADRPVISGSNSIAFTLPSGSLPDSTWSRFRLASQAGLSFTGQARDGEVEDYKIRILPAVTGPRGDFGDAPDGTTSIGTAMTAYAFGDSKPVIARFPTVLDEGSPPCGPMHLHPREAAFLGTSVTIEDAAEQGEDEDKVNNIVPAGDKPDLDGGDDGVPMPLKIEGSSPMTFQYTVTVADTSKARGMFVNAWFDWNRDGDWDDDIDTGTSTVPEWAVQNQIIPFSGPGTFSFMTPEFMAYDADPASGKQVWMRITLAEIPWTADFAGMKQGSGGCGPSGGYQYGETEDYCFSSLQEGQLDFGDAPKQYPTYSANDGASHVIVPGMHLGRYIDAETDGQPSEYAGGDNEAGMNDEDGVTFPTSMGRGDIEITVVAGSNGYLNAWIDFNRDGSWDNGIERIFMDQWLTPGENKLSFSVPAECADGFYYVRFRFGSEMGLGPSGPARDGEVEDYEIPIGSSALNDRSSKLPAVSRLFQNYPNPFNPSTRIEFDLSRPERVTLTIFSPSGKQVATLCDGPYNAGHHAVAWDGRDMSGNPVANGVYICRIEAGSLRDAKKLLMMK